MPGQRRLALKDTSRPRLAENLHAKAVVLVIITRSGKLVATWRKIDAVDASVDAHRALDLERLGVVDVNHFVVAPRGQPLPAGAPRNSPHSV